MFFRSCVFIVMVLPAISLWAQHTGHPQSSPPQGETEQTVEDKTRILNINAAVKASQKLFRDLEKAVRPWDETRFGVLASQYEQSIEDLVRSVDAADPDERNYAKNLNLADRTLARHLQQLQALSSTIPEAGSELLVRLTDTVTLSRDAILSQQEAFRNSAPHNGGTHGGSGHGCGSRLVRWLPLLLLH